GAKFHHNARYAAPTGYEYAKASGRLSMVMNPKYSPNTPGASVHTSGYTNCHAAPRNSDTVSTSIPKPQVEFTNSHARSRQRAGSRASPRSFANHPSRGTGR